VIEMKFQIWDKENKKIILPAGSNFMIDLMGNIWQFTHYEGELFQLIKAPSSNFKILEFTTFKDKNNKEVYEDYIVKYKYHTPLDTKEIYHRVHWEDGCWYMTTKSGRTLPLWMAEKDKLEVVGTIYQNSKLLEELDDR